MRRQVVLTLILIVVMATTAGVWYESRIQRSNEQRQEQAEGNKKNQENLEAAKRETENSNRQRKKQDEELEMLEKDLRGRIEELKKSPHGYPYRWFEPQLPRHREFSNIPPWQYVPLSRRG